MSDASQPLLPRRRYRFRVLDHFIIVALLIGLALLFLWPAIFVTIGSGHVGVLFSLFGGGTVTRFVYNEGVVAKWPWDTIYSYETRIQARNYEIKVLSQSGLVITVKMTTLFQPVADEAGFLHREIGPDYVDRIVFPSSVEAVRQIVGQYGPHDLYTTSTFQLETEVNEELRQSTVGRHIHFDAVVIRSIMLPKQVDQAINEKLQQQQIAQSYQYRIEQAAREAERKRIEAIGIQTFYSIVADALSPSLLTWRGIEATVDLAKSTNSKVVIVGGGKDQLPLILGSDITQQPALPAPTTVDPQSHELPDLTKLPPMFPQIDSGLQKESEPSSPQGDAAPTGDDNPPSDNPTTPPASGTQP